MLPPRPGSFTRPSQLVRVQAIGHSTLSHDVTDTPVEGVYSNLLFVFLPLGTGVASVDW